MSQPHDEVVVKQFWETTFFYRLWMDHFREAPGIIEYLYRMRDQQARGVASGVAPQAKSAQGLYESDFDLFARNHPGLTMLKQFIVTTLQQVVARINGSEVDPRRIRITLPDSWAHITNDWGFHDAHGHGNCSWCGIYYVQVGEAGARPPGPRAGAPNGGTRFYAPLMSGGSYRDYGNQYLDRSHLDPPCRDGMLLLFPSYLTHSGLPYRGTQDRIVIAFNAQAQLLRDVPDKPRTTS